MVLSYYVYCVQQLVLVWWRSSWCHELCTINNIKLLLSGLLHTRFTVSYPRRRTFWNGCKIKEFGSYLFNLQQLVAIIVLIMDDSFPLITYSVCHLCLFHSSFTATWVEFYKWATISASEKLLLNKNKNKKQWWPLAATHNFLHWQRQISSAWPRAVPLTRNFQHISPHNDHPPTTSQPSVSSQGRILMLRLGAAQDGRLSGS